MTLTLLLLLVLGLVSASADSIPSLDHRCPCGFKDSNVGVRFTDAMIVYFNESKTVNTTVFETHSFENKNEKGWNSIFRRGASADNVGIGNNDSLPWQNRIDGTSPSLEMFLDGYSSNHLSDGAEIRSLRRDILHGSFRASMRSAQPWTGGSAMSMYLHYNESESIEIDMLNMDDANQARVMQTVDGEFPSDQLAVNYSSIQSGKLPGLQTQSPWDFMELRFDWMPKEVRFWVDDSLTRKAQKSETSLPKVPQTLYFSHWSTGDALYMQGPPVNRSVANLQWVRAFFNSSVMTKDGHNAYDQRCDKLPACSMDDIALRGYTEYSHPATISWKPPKPNESIRTNAGYVAASFSVLGVVSLINAFMKRSPMHKLRIIFGRRNKKVQEERNSSPDSDEKPSGEWDSEKSTPKTASLSETSDKVQDSRPSETQNENTTFTEHREPKSQLKNMGSYRSFSTTSSRKAEDSATYVASGTTTPLPRYTSQASLVRQYRTAQKSDAAAISRPGQDVGHSSNSSIFDDSDGINTPGSGVATPAPTYCRRQPSTRQPHSTSSRGASFEINHVKRSHEEPSIDTSHQTKPEAQSNANQDDEKEKSSFSFDKQERLHNTSAQDDQILACKENEPNKDDKKGFSAVMTTELTTIPGKPKVPAKQRIDHLAGLVAVSCIMVTLRHFSLTFWPYVTEAQGPIEHFAADRALSYVLGPYVLTPFWIGPFFMTSCRFLAQRYLRNASLDDIGNKMLLRAPRMLVPCFVFMTLEYFLLSLGVTSRLEWLPSVSWSTWPYVQPQKNFGVFLNEMVELAYLIPNAAPEVVNNYCIGVLWTIPVQLQFSFVVLLAAVLIRGVTKPWKRMLFYCVTILAGWYATSWSSSHWIGLLLADLDISYGWIKWTQARWWALYPILTTAAILTLAAPLALLFNSAIVDWSFMSYENAIHPDPTTGLPIWDTVETIWDAYPPYYAPSLAVLVFSAGLQVLVELSTWIQKFLSLKAITFLHPHIMTIYLTHGLVFWSLGSNIAVSLNSTGIPYWAILLIVAIVCYSVIILAAVFVTPLVDAVTMGTVRNIWRWATENPVKWRRTTAPFSADLVQTPAKNDNTAGVV